MCPLKCQLRGISPVRTAPSLQDRSFLCHPDLPSTSFLLSVSTCPSPLCPSRAPSCPQDDVQTDHPLPRRLPSGSPPASLLPAADLGCARGVILYTAAHVQGRKRGEKEAGGLTMPAALVRAPRGLGLAGWTPRRWLAQPRSRLAGL